MPVLKRVLLTRTMIESAKPDEAEFRLRDSKVPGLTLRVLPSGAKSWSVMWGRGQARTIGKFPNMTLEAARVQSRAVLSEIDVHGSPLAVIDAQARQAEIRTFGDFMRESYGPHVEATAKAGKMTVHCIAAQFGHLYDRTLASIQRLDFDEFKAKRLKAGLHPSTVNRDMDRLKAALSQAVEWKLLTTNPLLGMKRIKRGIENRVRFLSQKEEKALRMALEVREVKFKQRRASGIAWRVERGREPLAPIEGYYDHLLPMSLVALNTGLRRGEITQLTWADIDLTRKLLTVRAGYAKSGKERHVPLNSEVLDLLKRYKRQHGGQGRLFDIICVKKSWAGLMTAAKIEDFRFHDLRHTFASKLVMAGVDLNTVRELLGHGDIKMTLRYAHLAPEHRAAAVEKLVR